MEVTTIVRAVLISLKEVGVHATLRAFCNSLVPSTLFTDDPKLVPIRIALCICLYANPKIFSNWFVAAQDLDTRSSVLQIMIDIKRIRKLRDDRDSTLRGMIYQKNVYAGVEYTVDLNRKAPPSLLVMVMFAEYMGNHKMSEHISVINGFITFDEEYYRKNWDKLAQVFSYDYNNPIQLQPRFFPTWTEPMTEIELMKLYGGRKFLRINAFGRRFFRKNGRHPSATDIMEFFVADEKGILPPNMPFWVGDYISRCSFAPHGYFKSSVNAQAEEILPTWPSVPLETLPIDPFFMTSTEKVDEPDYKVPESVNIYVDESSIVPVQELVIEEALIQCPLVEYFSPIPVQEQSSVDLFNVGYIYKITPFA